jgi:hypothetical protein
MLMSKCQNRHFQEDWRPLFLEICGRRGIRVYDRKTCSHTCHVRLRDVLSEELTAISLPVGVTELRGLGRVMLSVNICVDLRVVRSLADSQTTL